MAPGDVTGVMVGKSGMVTWDEMKPAWGDGTVYQLALGSLLELLASGHYAGAQCGGGNISMNEWLDPLPLPGIGDGRYDLVRGKNACGIGTWGASQGGVRSTLVACP